jgi:Penicillin tolerance protein
MDENDIDKTWIDDIESVGISAGACTPDNIINKVINKVKTISNINIKEEIYE